jgi:hypothetical protein
MKLVHYELVKLAGEALRYMRRRHDDLNIDNA